MYNTDTQILDGLLAQMRSYAVTGVPLPPARIVQWINKAYEQRECVRREGDTYTNGTSFSDRTVSDFYKTPGPYAVDYKKNDPYPSLHEQRQHFDADITGRHDFFWRAITNERREPQYECKPTSC